MPGRKKKSSDNKRTIALVVYASEIELASLVKDNTIPFEYKINIGKRKARLALRRTLDEVFKPDKIKNALDN